MVGHDWGASVAWVTALMYPGVVEKLIIMNCPHPGAFKELFAKSTTQIGKSWSVSPISPDFGPLLGKRLIFGDQKCYTCNLS